MLKSLLLFGVAVALCVAALPTFRSERGNTDAYNSYRYKSIGFENVVVRVAGTAPVRYGARQFAAFRIIVLNEDKARRVNWVLIGFPVTVAEERRCQPSAFYGKSSFRPAKSSWGALSIRGPATQGS